MEVQVGIEVFLIERVDRLGVLRGDVIEAHVLANHTAILRFHKAVVVGLPRPRFPLLDQQLVQHPRNRVVDELASVLRDLVHEIDVVHALTPS